MNEDSKSNRAQECEKTVDNLRSITTSSDRYRINRMIAKGGMGIIYHAYDKKLKRDSVIKVLQNKFRDNPQQLLKFIDEARITGRLEHPNIIPVSDIGILDEDQIFFAMKRINGESLQDILIGLRNNQPAYSEKYTLFSLLTIFRKICDACTFAHSVQMIHRDIKPENIMVGEFGEVLLVDWGLAKEYGKKSDLRRLCMKTIEGIVQGSPNFMSPEQAFGETDNVDCRTDIFLLGSTLYSIATLYPPYESESGVIDIVKLAEECSYIDPQTRAPNRQIPQTLCHIIAKAMQYKPTDRYQSVAELCRDLDAFMEGHILCTNVSFKKGDYLMMEGEKADAAYLILRGKVEVFAVVDGIRIDLTELSEGDCLGEMALISNQPRSAFAKALTYTDVAVISSEMMNRGIDNMPAWLAKAVKFIVKRLQITTNLIHPLHKSDCTFHVMNQLKLLYPLMGEKVFNVQWPENKIAVKLSDMVHEITQNLALTTEPVNNVILKLAEVKLVEILLGEYIYIANLPNFCEFVNFFANQKGLKTTIPKNRIPFLFVNDKEFIDPKDNNKTLTNRAKLPGSSLNHNEQKSNVNQWASETAFAECYNGIITPKSSLKTESTKKLILKNTPENS